jgi:hypothetical protein
MKFKNKPKVIEAFQFRCDPCPDWFMDKVTDLSIITHDKYCDIQTRAVHGDFIIKGIKGEIYPCKPDIFERNYEVAE